MKTPGFKYDKSYKLTDIDPKMAKMWKESENNKKEGRITKINKDKSVSPTSYDMAKSFDST